jgi:SAM-dependent methyltransferase
MGEQLKHTNSETVYFDFSNSSMQIAQSRAKMRGSLNIIWIIGWIESISRHGLGNFDFVLSTGVLHHLKNPQKGLNMLNDIQLEHGGASFMVYGKYGRTGIYHLQELMRKINGPSQSMDNELHSANVILEILSEKHWFHHFTFTDTETFGNNGIYDLLLHKRDRSYSIQELHLWLERGSYNFVEFLRSEDTTNLSLKGRKLKALKLLYNKLLKMNICEQQRISEVIWGKVFKQEIFASKQPNSKSNNSTNPTSHYQFTLDSPKTDRVSYDDYNKYHERQ